MLKGVLIPFVLVASIGSAAAQRRDAVVSESAALTLLASTDAQDQAWGAWMAGRLLMSNSSPEIEKMVREGLTVPHFDARVDIGLDALIETNAKADLQLLADLWPRRPVQAMILLSRLGPKANPLLLSIMSRSQGWLWFAPASLLYEAKAPGFAAILLRDVELVAEVVVSRDGNLGRGEGGVSVTVGDGAGGTADGYPPSTVYEFRRCDRAGVTVLASGPSSVCYERARSAAGFLPSLSSHDYSGPSTAQRLHYFSAVVSSPPSASRQIQIAWTNDADLKKAAAELVAQMRTSYRDFVRQLVERKWLSAEEAARVDNPAVRERIIDLR